MTLMMPVSVTTTVRKSKKVAASFQVQWRWKQRAWRLLYVRLVVSVDSSPKERQMAIYLAAIYKLHRKR